MFIFMFIYVYFSKAPSKKNFSRDKMNWVDAIAILPYFVTLLMEWLSQSDWDMFGEVKL